MDVYDANVIDWGRLIADVVARETDALKRDLEAARADERKWIKHALDIESKLRGELHVTNAERDEAISELTAAAAACKALRAENERLREARWVTPICDLCGARGDLVEGEQEGIAWIKLHAKECPARLSAAPASVLSVDAEAFTQDYYTSLNDSEIRNDLMRKMKERLRKHARPIDVEALAKAICANKESLDYVDGTFAENARTDARACLAFLALPAKPPIDARGLEKAMRDAVNRPGRDMVTDHIRDLHVPAVLRFLARQPSTPNPDEPGQVVDPVQRYAPSASTSAQDGEARRAERPEGPEHRGETGDPGSSASPAPLAASGACEHKNEIVHLGEAYIVRCRKCHEPMEGATIRTMRRDES